MVEFLKHPEFLAIGARILKVLLFGSPEREDTGWSSLPVRRKYPFNISGSEFVEMFVGGASRVRDLSKQAKEKCAGYCVYRDEIDAVGRHPRRRFGRRAMTNASKHLIRFFVEMDGFETETNVIVIASTNRRM